MQNTIKEITAQVTAQKWEEPFRDLLNEIFWPGYAEQLSENKPDEYVKEYFYFMALYE